ncbi:hypothetical protein B0I33_107206 [Prauserella shujinwangii]|uniref:DsbA family dithiol-disulfide isomerase n=1 Tax=Prauserella shujinwangii TaxID=1453103 RepID=A0A2T0LSH8_9PSEU|nr:disulfide bond formation protein DsbA [Prauserella shujinwangii]PRX46629.1 hypothetical protein B0I33_107206 [Prauserella shujinwangii]
MAAEGVPAGEPEEVDVWVEPICPWAWLVSRWMLEVQRVRPVRARWHVMSLYCLNEGKEVERKYRKFRHFLDASFGAVRVFAAARQKCGPECTLPLYEAMGRRVHLDQRPLVDRPLIQESLAEAGLPGELAEFADRTDYDELARASHDEAIALVGDEVGAPVVRWRTAAFFGPVVSPAPRGEQAGRLWDACTTLAGVDGFYELKRRRDRGPVFG